MVLSNFEDKKHPCPSLTSYKSAIWSRYLAWILILDKRNCQEVEERKQEQKSADRYMGQKL